MLRKIVVLILWILALILSVVFLVAFFVSLRTPRMDRNWESDSRILPKVTMATSTVTIKDIRDWRYEKDKVVSDNYYDDTFDLSKMKQAYLLFNPFGEWQGVGHSFLMFEFEDGKEIAVSIEARREKDEPYSVVRGVLNEYEIWYAFGTPEDFITRRTIYNDEDLYKYPLLISTSTARSIFVDLSTTARDLETKPAFYNTITSNCTNLLADSANRVHPGSIPWSFARLFTGYADNQLYELGLIPHDKPFEEMYEEARIDGKIREYKLK